jgi:hypothetical protein
MIFLIALVASPLLRSTPCSNATAEPGDLIQLSGILLREAHWGPPNFGEDPSSDSLFTVWIIAIDDPLKFRSTGSVDSTHIDHIQIELDQHKYSKKSLERLIGRRVIVSGRLWEATSPGDTTPMIIDAVDVALIDKPVPICP